MKRMIDLDEMQFLVYIAYQSDLDVEDLLRIFLELGISYRYVRLTTCKECKHYSYQDGGYCNHYKCMKSPGDFCSDGDDSSMLLS